MQWSRANGMWKSKYFQAKEFTCRCGLCSQQFISDQLIEKLDGLREELGLPITITSGYRCSRHQASLRAKGEETAKGTSSHETGLACDVTCSDMEKLKALAPKYFNNIGTAKTFLHLDIRHGGPRAWSYNG